MEEKKDKLGGVFEEKKGEVKEGIGDFRGDESQQAEGQLDQAEGKFDQVVADVKEKIADFLDGDDNKK